MRYAIIPIEIKQRELDARLLLAATIVLKGKGRWAVVIGNRRTVVRRMLGRKFSPYIFVSKGMFFEKSFFDDIRVTGGKFTLLDEEGGVTTKFVEEQFPVGGTDNPCLKYVEGIFFWGKRSKEIYIKNQPRLKPGQIAVTGHPKFDLSKPLYDPYFWELRKAQGSAQANIVEPYVLINTAFVENNNLVPYETQKACIDPFKRAAFVAQVGIEKQEEQKLMAPFLDGLEKLFSSCPSINFLLRPHPAERSEFYVDRFGRFDNVCVSKQGNVHEVMRDSVCVIHHGCTTAVEGRLNNKRVICFVPIYDEYHTPWLPVKVSTIARSSGELVDMVTGAASDDNEERCLRDWEEIGSEVKDVIENLETSSVDKIFEFLDNVTLATPPWWVRITLSPFLRTQKYLKRLFRWLRDVDERKKAIEVRKAALFREAVFERKRHEKIDSLELSDLEVRLQALRAVELTIDRIEIEDLGEQAFLLKHRVASTNE